MKIRRICNYLEELTDNLAILWSQPKDNVFETMISEVLVRVSAESKTVKRLFGNKKESVEYTLQICKGSKVCKEYKMTIPKATDEEYAIFRLYETAAKHSPADDLQKELLQGILLLKNFHKKNSVNWIPLLITQ